MGADGLASGALVEFESMNRATILSPLKGCDNLDNLGLAHGTKAARAHDRALIRLARDYCAQAGITSAVNMDGNPCQAGLMRDLAQ